MSAAVANSRKAMAARCQLGTALALHLAEADPVSVLVLGCGGLEVAEALALKCAAKPFSAFSYEVHPDLTKKELLGLRNRAWNAMKHAHSRNGRERNDEELLSSEWHADNEAILSEGWFNLGQIGMPLPIEAQAFNTWVLVKHGAVDQIQQEILDMFPGIRELDAHAQLQSLRDMIALAKSIPEVVHSPQTDPRPLMLSYGEIVVRA